MLPEEIKQYILALKHRQEMNDVINHPLKKALNREIQNYGHVMNEIKYRLSLPNVKKVTLKFGFFQRKNRLKYHQPEFVCHFYSKRGPYWYYNVHVSIMHSDRYSNLRTYNTTLGRSFNDAVAKINSVWNPFSRNLFDFIHSCGIQIPF